MKKITILFICFIAISANAQVTVKPGVRAGLNLATISNTNLDTKADFYVGGFVAIKLAKFYTLQPELTYTRQGAKGTEYEYTSDFDPIATRYSRDVDYSLQYVSLGLMNKFTFVKGFHAIVGPTIDIKVGDNFPAYASDELIAIDLGLNGGIGYTFPMGLTIEARYKIGLIDIFGDYYNDDYYDSGDNRFDDTRLNSVLQLGVCYAF